MMLKHRNPIIQELLPLPEIGGAVVFIPGVWKPLNGV
jgi:hypothetical protein